LLLAGTAARSPWASGSSGAISLEQPDVVVARTGNLAALPCKASTKVNYIHWYHHQEGMAPERILRLDMSGSSMYKDSVLKADKVMATKDKDGTSCNLFVLKLEKSDEGVYYCATVDRRYGWWYYIKVFGPGTWLRVTDNIPDKDISPKPTIFLPSIAEVKVHNAGTYLCLLEDFFPDIIKIDWKEKDGKTILKSQQGDSIKTKDTYMKFSWLTVTGTSMVKDHKCIVNHESDRRRVDQEILFPSINKGMCEFLPRSSHSNKANEGTSVNSFKTTCEINKMLLLDTLQLQLANTSAYYTYVLLLLKSLVYSAIIAICLLGRPALYGNGKS
uniref:Ig-like domain-containing protein n=1 Tax=Ailuropoda melanoleuca TaxID=9646 RepID=G1L3P5_AILME